MAEKKTLMEEIQLAIKELAQEHKKTEAAMKETQLAQQKTEAAMKETQLAQQKTEVSQQKTEAALQDLKKFAKDISADNKKRTDKLENLFTTQWGKLMESLVEGDLVKMLVDKGIDVETTMQNVKKERDGERWEVDILALNGDDVVVVEVKTTLRVKDVDRLVGRTLQNFTGIFPVYGGKRILGAVAYLRMEESADTYAEKKGLYVIRATGSSASIVNRENFEPRVF